MFRLRNDVDEWFSNIYGQGPINSKFDLYYFCLMMGLASNKRNDSSDSGVRDLVQYFIVEYQQTQKTLLGLLTVVHLHEKGVAVDEKEEVQKEIASIITPDTQSKLTEYGFKSLNSYASGGFEHIVEKFGSKPHTLPEFLRFYMETFEEAMNSNKIFSNYQA